MNKIYKGYFLSFLFRFLMDLFWIWIILDLDLLGWLLGLLFVIYIIQNDGLPLFFSRWSIMNLIGSSGWARMKWVWSF